MNSAPYETQRYLHEYLLLHYGSPKDISPFPLLPVEWTRFHTRLRQECVPAPKPARDQRASSTTRALDLGCSVGRFTFELSLAADHVLGIDTSESFIRAARRMAARHEAHARVKESGSQFSNRKLLLPKMLRHGAVGFQVGDAMDLGRFPDGGFEVVAAINLLCRLPSPKRFLAQLHRLVPFGGQLIIASPFTWMEEYTPRREWLRPEQLPRLLAPHFRLARRRDLPFLIREHRRKYQLVVSDVFTFVRRASTR